MPWTAAPLAALNGSKQWGTRAKLAHPIDHRQKDAHDLNGKEAQREYRKTTRGLLGQELEPKWILRILLVRSKVLVTSVRSEGAQYSKVTLYHPTFGQYGVTFGNLACRSKTCPAAVTEYLR